MTKERWATITSLAVGASLAIGAAAHAGSYREVTMPPTPVTPTDGFAFYNPTLATIQDGGTQYLYLFVQGGTNDPEPCPGGIPVTGDALYAFRAPIDPATKLPGAFSRVGRISPCVPRPPGVGPLNENDPNIHPFWGPGQVFRSKVDGTERFYLLADVGNSAIFSHWWLGSTSDGRNWTWQVSSITAEQNEVYARAGEVGRTITSVPVQHSFLESSELPGYLMLNPIVVARNYGQTDEYWWGFFNYRTPDLAEHIGQLKVTWNDPGTIPTVSVLTSTAPYTYQTLVNGYQLTSQTQPASLKQGAAKSLLWSAVENSWELWGGSAALNATFPYSSESAVAGCSTSTTQTCDYYDVFWCGDPNDIPPPATAGCFTGDQSCVPFGQTGNVYLYNTGVQGEASNGHGSGFAWWRVSETSFDQADNVLTSEVRAMPSGHEFGRQFPARWDAQDVNGTRYLFSATNDQHMCESFLWSAYYKMNVVMTQLAYTPSPPASVLTIAKAGTGSGTVTSTPTGISCGSDCQESYATGTLVNLVPQWNSGSNFRGWTGDPDCEDGAVTMSAARTCTATFNTTFGASRTLTISKSGSGTVTSHPSGVSCGSDCSQSYPYGTVVVMIAQPAAGFTFSGWSGAADCADGKVTLTLNRSCTANFVSGGSTYTLSVSSSGTGAGTVTSSPSGINCGSVCQASFASGTSVTLTPIPAVGSTFSNWTGDADCTDGVVAMSGNRSCAAVFNSSAGSKSLAILKAGTGSGTVTSIPAGIACGTDCQEAFTTGQSVVLEFAAASGSAFSAWTGDADCSDGNLTMSADRSCTATFIANPAATAHVTWIQPGDQAQFGPPDGLVIAGTASGAPSGTPVLLRWRNASTGGGWVIDSYPPTPDPVTGAWFHSIAPANFNQQYDVYVTYGTVTAPICTYQGSDSITWCP